MIEDILDSILSWFTEQILLAAMDSFQMQMSWWIGESYSQNFADRKGAGGVLYFLRVHTNWLTSLMAFAGFIFAAFRAAIQRKGEPFRAAFSQFFELAIIVLMLATVVQLASIAGDRYSSWILWEAAPKDSNWTKKWNEELGPHQQAGTIFLLAIFGVFLTISSLIQWGLMLFRSAAMVVLVGIIPVFAASRYTSYGERAYKMAMGYLISWWAYGPIAATGAAAGQRLMASDYQADRFAGMALIIGMVFALPAVFSAIMPAVREDNNSFSPRQVGHFLFGGTAVNVGKLNGVWSGATGYINKRLTPEGNPSGPRGNPSGPRGNPNGPNGNPNGPNGNPNGPNGNPNGPNGNPNGPRSNPNGPRGNPNVPNGTPPNGSKGHPPNGPSGTLSNVPSGNPSSVPWWESNVPSGDPSNGPSGNPSSGSKGHPPNGPSGTLSNVPSGNPSSVPWWESNVPSGDPSNGPSGNPSNGPSGNPSNGPSGGTIAGGGDRPKPDTRTLRDSLGEVRGPSGADQV